jgi:16S rRNA (guanine966-N2)-methyltransferase
MRIVGGKFRGRPLVAPGGLGTRPTTDRTRESLFNILAHNDLIDLDGARVIDLFAGSGALGFEAISRGAAFCLFVETAAAARGAIRTNQETLGLTGCTRIHRRSALSLGPKPTGVGAPFDLVFLDPPYDEGLVAPALAGLAAGNWLGPGALCIAEQRAGEALDLPPDYTCEDERRFGDTKVSFVRFEPVRKSD